MMKAKLFFGLWAVLATVAIGIGLFAEPAAALGYGHMGMPLFRDGKIWQRLDTDKDTVTDFYYTCGMDTKTYWTIYAGLDWKPCGMELWVNDDCIYDSFPLYTVTFGNKIEEEN